MPTCAELGRPVVPGVYRIVAVHSGDVPPRDNLRPIPDHFSRAVNVATDCVYVDGLGIQHNDEYLAKARADRRKISKAHAITWGTRYFGYGCSFRQFNAAVTRTLLHMGVDVRLFMYRQPDVLGGIDVPVIHDEAGVEGSVSIMNARFHPDPKVFRASALAAHATLGYFQAEGTLIDPKYAKSLNRFDAMLATSNATRQALIDSGVNVPVHVFGHGIEPKVFPLVNRPLRKPYTFLHWADVQWRKGTDLVIHAFRAMPFKDVRLHIKAQWKNNPYRNSYKEMTRGDDRIFWDFKSYRPGELAGLLSHVDAALFPHRGEGFGLPIIECEATGLPCVVTRFAGPLDTTHPHRLWVEVDRNVPAQVDWGLNAEPSMDSLVDWMHYCYRNPQAARIRGRMASEHIHKNWTWEAKCAELLDLLKGYGYERKPG
jgi:glycosyltransferase involved in cell wall biosynthesis